MRNEKRSTMQGHPLPVSLFQYGMFRLHSGALIPFKVDCDVLTPADWAALARFLAPQLWFAEVEGVPRGGIPFADALRRHSIGEGLLIVDDVLTTGASMEAQRAGREAQGLVLFARGPCPPWVRAVWQWEFDIEIQRGCATSRAGKE